MKFYPITVPRAQYRGADPRKRAKNTNLNRIADKVEKYLNADLAERPDDSVTVYMSYSVAHSISEDTEIVRNIIMGIDGGSNGVTIVKGDYERAMIANPSR
jgi:hypothetical protein